MKFFDLDPSLEDAVFDPEKGVGIRIEVEKEDGSFETLSDDAVNEAHFSSGFDSKGGITAFASVLLDDDGSFPLDVKEKDCRVKIFFTAGETGRYLHRFTMYPDEKGFKRKKQGGRDDVMEVFLEDFPFRMKRTGGYKDWSEAIVLTDMKISDKEDTENSLLYRIASRGGIEEDEIDSCTVPLIITYVKLDKEPWDELCSLADASLSLIEGGTDKKIIFSSSPYQTGNIEDDEEAKLDISLFHFIETESALDLFFNDIRLKWMRPERLEKQIIWSYDDNPVFYDSYLKKSYPFRVTGEKRDIELTDVIYTAPYEVKLSDGSRKNVVYADMVDDKDTAEANIDSDINGINISGYDSSSYKDRAFIKLDCLLDTDLYSLSISGRPIILRENFSCFRRDDDSIERYGLKVLNKTGSYFSDDIVLGKKHYEEWTERLLTSGMKRRRRIRVKSEYSLFHARTGSRVRLSGIDDEGILLSVERLEFSYKRGEIFKADLLMIEEFS